MIGTVGRLDPAKNQAMMIRALAPRLSSQLRLVIVGDGPLRDDIRAEVARLADPRWVVLAGRRMDVPRLMPAFDVFALSSASEGLPLVILEAMAAGLPIASTAVGGIPDVVEDGVTGVLSAVDSRAFAAAVGGLVADPTRTREMGRAGQGARARPLRRRPHGRRLPRAVRARRRVIVAVDVDYRADAVVTACVGFAGWANATTEVEWVATRAGAAEPYEPGQFYRRELPYLLTAVAAIEAARVVDAVVVDAHAWLDAGRPGLGAHLATARGGATVVVGVAKTRYRGGAGLAVLRGSSRTPLWVSAVGIDAAHAAESSAACTDRIGCRRCWRGSTGWRAGRGTAEPSKRPV